MSSDILTQIADRLAQDVLAAEPRANRDDLVDDIAKSVGATSTTLQEAFLTQIRVRRAEARGRMLLARLAPETAPSDDTASGTE
ncbi:MAG: hypothetical protein ABNH26_13885 [Celeribacter sp.]|jgi:hypothetical protein